MQGWHIDRNKIQVNQNTIPWNVDTVSNKIQFSQRAIPCSAIILRNDIQFNQFTVLCTENITSNTLHEDIIPTTTNERLGLHV